MNRFGIIFRGIRVLLQPNDRVASELVRSFYPKAFHEIQWVRLGNAGGFSGATIWQGIVDGDCIWCLKKWPLGAIPSDRLEWIHRLMTIAREEGLWFVPIPQRIRFNASISDSIVEWDGCAWEITDWMPGIADFYSQPTHQRLENVLQALAKLHRIWREHPFLRLKREGPCPAIARRLQAIRDFDHLGETLNNIRFEQLPGLSQDLCQKAIRILPFWMEFAQNPLRDANRSSFFLQYCLCDIWHDHVLFEGNKVRGIIDYGGVKIDHVSIDLARLLGSLIPDQPDRLREALRMYQAFSKEESDWYELVDLLDWTGVVIGVFNWVRWLGIEKRKFDDLELVSKRMSHLLERLQRLAIRLRISIPR